MAGDIKLKYGTSAALTMTGIEDVDSSASWIGGWSSNSIDNTTNLDEDILISGQFTLESTSRQAGWIYVYAYGLFTGSTWPDLFSSGTEGTVGAATVHDIYRRDSGMATLASIYVGDATASAVYSFPWRSIRRAFGAVPEKFALWVTSNACSGTADWCVASGTTLYQLPVKRQYT